MDPLFKVRLGRVDGKARHFDSSPSPVERPPSKGKSWFPSSSEAAVGFGFAALLEDIAGLRLLAANEGTLVFVTLRDRKTGR